MSEAGQQATALTVSYAAKVSTPVLIVHRERDTNVPVGQAMYFHRALTQFGAEHELVIYP